jgi:3-dehydroquinate synthetase
MSELFHTVDVNLGADGGHHKGKDRSYPIAIGKGLLTDSRLWAEVIGSRGVVLVTDDQGRSALCRAATDGAPRA